MTHLLPSAFAARAVTTSHDPVSSERQGDLLVLASFLCSHSRPVQISADAALDVAHLLHEPLAVGPTAPSAPTGAPHAL